MSVQNYYARAATGAFIIRQTHGIALSRQLRAARCIFYVGLPHFPGSSNTRTLKSIRRKHVGMYYEISSKLFPLNFIPFVFRQRGREAYAYMNTNV